MGPLFGDRLLLWIRLNPSTADERSSIPLTHRRVFQTGGCRRFLDSQPLRAPALPEMVRARPSARTATVAARRRDRARTHRRGVGHLRRVSSAGGRRHCASSPAANSGASVPRRTATRTPRSTSPTPSRSCAGRLGRLASSFRQMLSVVGRRSAGMVANGHRNSPARANARPYGDSL